MKLVFLPDLTEDLIKYLTDYFDSVRELAQDLVGYILTNFLPLEEV